jgi:retinol dehydrogenase 12
MSTALSIVSQISPPKPKWSVDDIPDLLGKVIIVTGQCYGSLPCLAEFLSAILLGGNTGIGKETAKVRRYLLYRSVAF